MDVIRRMAARMFSRKSASSFIQSRRKIEGAVRNVIEALESRRLLTTVFEGTSFDDSTTIHTPGNEGWSYTTAWSDGDPQDSTGWDGTSDPYTDSADLSFSRYFDDNTDVGLSVTVHWTADWYPDQSFDDVAYSQDLQVLNVQPTADFHFSIDENNDNQITASLTNPSDPSQADTNAGFKYSFATNPDNLADNYGDAGTSSSATLDYSSGTVIYARVFDKDSGYSDFSSADALLPTINAASISPTGVTLSWLDVTDGQAVRWRVRRSDDGVNYSDTHWTLADPDARDYTDTSVEPGQTYYYIVRGLGAADDPTHVGQTPFSFSIQVAIPDFSAPSGLTADEAGPTTASLNWTDETDYEDGFKILRSDDQGDTWNTIDTVGTDATTYTATISNWSADPLFEVEAYMGDPNSPTLVSDPSEAVPVTPATPTIVTQPTSPGSPLTGVSTNLSILGGGILRGASYLTYTWSETSKPSDDTPDPDFSDNGTNAGKNTTATFFAAGTYTLICTVDNNGASVDSNEITVTVNQTASSIAVDPGYAEIGPDDNPLSAVSASELDQFGDPMATQPTFNWTTTTAPEAGHWILEQEWGSLHDSNISIQDLSDPNDPNTLIWQYSNLPAHSAIRVAVQAALMNPDGNAHDWWETVLDVTANGQVLPTDTVVSNGDDQYLETSIGEGNDGQDVPYTFLVDDSGGLTLTMKLSNTHEGGWTWNDESGPLVQLAAYVPYGDASAWSNAELPLPGTLMTNFITVQAAANGMTATAVLKSSLAPSTSSPDQIGDYKIVAVPTAASMNPKFDVPTGWINIANAPVASANSAFAAIGGNILNKGWMLDTGQIVDFTFAAGTLINGPGDDLVVLNGGWSSSTDAYRISCDYNNFGTGYTIDDNWVGTGEIEHWYRGYGINGASEPTLSGNTEVMSAGVDLTSLGVPSGAAVTKIRVYVVDGENTADLFGVASISSSPKSYKVDLQVDSDNNGTVNSNDDKIEDDKGKPGVVIHLNENDDNNNGKPDGLENGTVSGEADWVPMQIKPPPGVTSGTMTLTMAAGGPYVRVWQKPSGTSNQVLLLGLLAPQSSITLPIASYLNGLTVWLEGRDKPTGAGAIRLTLSATPDGANAPASTDAIRATVVAAEMAVDNNRDNIIHPDGTTDWTTPAKPFLFWLNDNADMWGGSGYAAAIDNSNSEQVDSQIPGIGSNIDADGNTITGNALREVQERDLEDFAALGFRWSSSMDGIMTGLRVSLTSATDPGMAINLFASARKAPATGGADAFDATAHASDSATITTILSRVANTGANGFAISAGQSKTINAADLTSFGEVNGSSGYKLLQMMFEGVGAGSGTLKFELMNGTHALTSWSTYIRLRPINQLYDHYSVAQPSKNVNADGTYKDKVGALTNTTPVVTAPALVGQNLERARIQKQSSDYFLFVHGWNDTENERVATAESAYKRMYWSGYTGQFGMFDWPTEATADPTTDPGNFDRSEYIAWNSATGLANALKTIRKADLNGGGNLSVMAHSMGNIVLDEAMYQNETWQNSKNKKIVDTAIMSQAAVSDHYFSSKTFNLPSLYLGNANPIYEENHVADHGSGASEWSEYYGFDPNGANTALDVIGGTTPRFRNINLAAGKLLDYYNPDDYALGTWRADQATKPTRYRTNTDMAGILDNVNFGNVNAASYLTLLEDALAHWVGKPIPGFASGTNRTQYIYNATNNTFSRQTMSDPDTQVSSPTPLSLSSNLYEMFAFCASSVVAPVGATDWHLFPGVFTSGQNLALLAPQSFNNLNTGHSAEFVHSYVGVKAYWTKLLGDIQ